MKTIRRPIAIAATAIGSLVLLESTLRTQPLPSVGPVWEYASVTGSSMMGAAICYSSAKGCSYDKAGAGGADSLMSAAAKLGERGWELAAAADEAGTGRTERTLYFKRLKSVINRSDS